MDEGSRAARCAVVLALLMVLGQAPLDEGWRASELGDLHEKAMTVGNSSHVVDILATPDSSDQAQYITKRIRPDRMDIVSFNGKLNIWEHRENVDGQWTISTYPMKGQEWRWSEWGAVCGPGWDCVLPLPTEYVMTEFGFFSIDYEHASEQGICSVSWHRLYTFTVYNMSNNSGVHSVVSFCSESGGAQGGDVVPSLGVSNANDFFSFGYTTCKYYNTGGNYLQWTDHLITVFSNGSNTVHSWEDMRAGYTGYTQCSDWGGPSLGSGVLVHKATRTVVTDDMSCLEAIGMGNSPVGVTDFAKLRCVNHHNESQIHTATYCSVPNRAAADICRHPPSWVQIDLHPLFSANASEIYLIETSYDTGNSTNADPVYDYSLYLVNLTGIHEIQGAWLPDSCSESFHHIWDAPMVCEDSSWVGGEQMIWYPGNNSTEDLSDALIPIGVSTDCCTGALPFHMSNTGAGKNYFTRMANTQGGFDPVILWSDYDGDGIPDLQDGLPADPTQHSDLDEDGYGDDPNGDLPDSCPNVPGTSTEDRYGCSDLDGDGWSDLGDAMPSNSGQWADSDSDGYGDNTEGFQGDDCPTQYGESNRDLLGCPDADYDGWSDANDAFPQESSQWEDSDGDGYGDRYNGFQGDACPGDYGTSTLDRFGCPDADGDGWSDLGDAFPDDPTQWADLDADGHGDNPDGFEPDEYPSNPMQWADSDGDGWGDDPFGLQGDGCPTEWGSSTQDVYGCPDTDGDGVSNGNDAFPLDPDYWLDSDRDGTPDSADDFPFDSTQWSDADGDGWGDNPTGPLADAFPNDPTQWADSDGDGLGENPDGDNPDPYLDDFDNDGYNDSVDILPQLPSPGDLDNDGVPDEQDEFVDDPHEWRDNDGDGDGDNSDPDDDNDGWSDVDEDRHGTDPLDPSSVPVEAFQIILPGTTIGLDSWDLIGIFGGGPIVLWLMFGFVTRNRRTRGIEMRMEVAESRQELEEIAQSTEFLLMLRLLGTHQGIRLERVRAELDDVLEAFEGSPIESFDHTGVVAREMSAEEEAGEEPAEAGRSAKQDPMDSYLPPSAGLPPAVSRDLMEPEEEPEIEDLSSMADDLDD